MPTFTSASEVGVFLRALLASASNASTVALTKGGELMAEQASALVRAARTNTGTLASSIHAEPTIGGLDACVVRASAPYAVYVEEDTVPHWPPISTLVAWAEQKGFDNPQQAGFLAARKISQVGTTGIHFMAAAYAADRDATVGLVRQGAAAVLTAATGGGGPGFGEVA